MCSCSYDRANSMINSKSFSYLRRIINFYLSITRPNREYKSATPPHFCKHYSLFDNKELFATVA